MVGILEKEKLSIVLTCTNNSNEMIKCQPIIAVRDVEMSSRWYQKLLGCQGTHGGPHFEMLADQSGEHFLFLHKWNEHDHPTLSELNHDSGKGLILYLSVEDIRRTFENAKSLDATMEAPIALSENSGKEEFSMRDQDGYYLMIAAK